MASLFPYLDMEEANWKRFFCIIGLDIGASFCIRTHFSSDGIKVSRIEWSQKIISTWKQPTELDFFSPFFLFPSLRELSRMNTILYVFECNQSLYFRQGGAG
jgi:hypothetical protein